MFKNASFKIMFVSSCLLVVICFSGCASGPSSYSRIKTASRLAHLKTAIIPFTNLTTEKDADKKIAYALITHLLNTNYFDVIETGEVQKAIRDAKVRKDEDLSLENIKSIGQLAGADVLLLGVVEEYKIDSSTLLGEKVFVPEVSLSTRMVSVKDGTILWSANHHRRGDDRVTVFGMGRIDSISELTDIIIKDIVKSLLAMSRTKRNALDMLNISFLQEEEPVEGIVSKKKIDTSPERDKAMEDAMIALENKEINAKKEGEKKEILSPSGSQGDIRQDLKGKYKEEYEKIKKQY